METKSVDFTSYVDPETVFLASSQETGHEWELYKENVRPLKRGRKIDLLNHALKSTTDVKIKKGLIEKRRNLIQEIDQYRGDDPLQPWLDCIKWVQESFPQGGDCSGLIVIYEQCVRTFWHDERYKNDLRYLKVWLEYAENCHDAEVIYSFIEANKIGLAHSPFYIAYALHMEKKNKIKTANEIFNRGIAVHAQPAEKLKEAYKKFFTRSMRRQNAPTEDCTESNPPVRTFGTALNGGHAGNQAAANSIFPRKKLKQDGCTRTPLSIYKDANNIDARMDHQAGASKGDPKLWCTLGSRSERNKENSAIPSKWTANKIPVRAVHSTRGVAPTPCIEILVDEECEKECKVEKEDVKSSTLQLRHGDHRDMKKETDLLRENPLRNFPFGSLPR
ncbi:non-receptor serine/threonine protein kinase [Lithospermum erythrorhizon]|uniref:Non-receptor serine/threonine protein kinase n=1 Tax=Lithospermum erythrorhizon TaxID=34254 RepID=A0AAV3NRX1_LITER